MEDGCFSTVDNSVCKREENVMVVDQAKIARLEKELEEARAEL